MKNLVELFVLAHLVPTPHGWVKAFWRSS